MVHKLCAVILSVGFLITVGLPSMPWSPLSYKNNPMPVLTPSVKPGEYIAVKVERCYIDAWRPWQKVATFSFARHLVDRDGNQVILTSGESEVEQGCQTIGSRAAQVPDGIPAGYYRIVGASQAWRGAPARFETEEFYIDGAPK